MPATQRVVSGLEARRFILDLALVRALGGGWRRGFDMTYRRLEREELAGRHGQRSRAS
ncbi:hypothetical protein ACRAWD_31680 [Caulobacter segnis]